MNSLQVFPFEYVPRDSRVIIYGLGAYGKSYIEQIETTHWCHIEAVSDSNRSRDAGGYHFVGLDEIPGINTDTIIIAMKNRRDAYDVYSRLVENGVNKEIIISPYTRMGEDIGAVKESLDDESPIRVMYLMRGGIGDAVMELALYERLVQLAPDIEIDLYGEPYCKYFFSTKDRIKNIYDYHFNEPDSIRYDLSIEANWGVRVWEYNRKKIESQAPYLYECIRKTEKDMARQMSFVERINEGKLLKKDRFWFMGRGEAWKLSPDMVHVDFIDEYERKYKSLGLKHYITVNCGADNRMLKEKGGQLHTKVWPKCHYEEFISLFKKEFPQIDVIQLGGEGQDRISGADRCFLGEDMELVKYILKNSIIHIDDEGGLAHLATAIGTKCVVLFGPTPMEILGYKQNTNISSGICSGCFGYKADWYRSCALGDEKPRCMYSISPYIVMESILTVIADRIKD